MKDVGGIQHIVPPITSLPYFYRLATVTSSLRHSNSWDQVVIARPTWICSKKLIHSLPGLKEDAKFQCSSTSSSDAFCHKVVLLGEKATLGPNRYFSPLIWLKIWQKNDSKRAESDFIDFTILYLL